MTREDIHLLYEYDRWANHKVIQSVYRLTPEQFTRDLGGSFRSVRDTLLHVIAGEWIWLQYWAEKTPSDEFVAGLRQRRDELFRADAYPTVAAVHDKWNEVEKAQINFVMGTSDSMLSRQVPFRGTHVRLAQLMQHVANHSTYHRGQIALMMRQLGAQPLSTDFHVFLVEGRSGASA